MALPTDKQTFIDHCLRNLGSPVSQINLSNDQITDAYDEAIRYFHEYHMDGTERMFHPLQITDDFHSTRQVQVDATIYSINEVFLTPYMGNGVDLVFNIEYQMTSDVIWAMFKGGNSGFFDYALMKQYLQEINFQTVGPTAYNYNPLTRRLRINLAAAKLPVGAFMVLDVMRFVDPEEFPLVHQSSWLIRYCTALLKIKWGTSMQKFSGIQLPGGVTINAAQILGQGESEKAALEGECDARYNLPMNFFVG